MPNRLAYFMLPSLIALSSRRDVTFEKDGEEVTEKRVPITALWPFFVPTGIQLFWFSSNTTLNFFFNQFGMGQGKEGSMEQFKSIKIPEKLEDFEQIWPRYEAGKGHITSLQLNRFLMDYFKLEKSEKTDKVCEAAKVKLT